MQIDLTFQLGLTGRFRDLAVWLPVPQDTPQQRRLALESAGNHAELALHHDPVHGAPILFVRWPGVQDDPQLTVSSSPRERAGRSISSPCPMPRPTECRSVSRRVRRGTAFSAARRGLKPGQTIRKYCFYKWF